MVGLAVVLMVGISSQLSQSSGELSTALTELKTAANGNKYVATRVKETMMKYVEL
jgi:uncharacterized membrane protein